MEINNHIDVQNVALQFYSFLKSKKIEEDEAVQSSRDLEDFLNASLIEA